MLEENKSFENKKFSLKIGTSSLPGVYPRFTGKGLNREGVYGIISTKASDSDTAICKDGVLNAILEAWNWAYKNKLDIWILPELCLDDEGLSFLKKYLESYDTYPRLVIPGTTYVQNSDLTYSNRAPIWVRKEDGSWDFSKYYNKVIPFAMNTNVNSPSVDVRNISIVAEAKGANVLEEGFTADSNIIIGSIDGVKYGVAICRDVLDVFDDKNPLFEYCNQQVDLMLVTSMNDGHTNLFTATAESMARWHNCTTIYVNNFTSVPKEQDNTVELSFALVPNTSKVAGINGLIYYRKAPSFNIASELSESNKELETDYAFENRVSAIYSGSVKACAIPRDGNVLYTISNGKLVM